MVADPIICPWAVPGPSTGHPDQSNQTLEPKQPWQLSTCTYTLLHTTRTRQIPGWECVSPLYAWMCMCLIMFCSAQVLRGTSPIFCPVPAPPRSRCQISHMTFPDADRGQFGASARILSFRGAVMEGKSKALSFIAGLPPSGKPKLSDTTGFLIFYRKPSKRRHLLLCNILAPDPGVVYITLHMLYSSSSRFVNKNGLFMLFIRVVSLIQISNLNSCQAPLVLQVYGLQVFQYFSNCLRWKYRVLCHVTWPFITLKAAHPFKAEDDTNICHTSSSNNTSTSL